MTEAQAILGGDVSGHLIFKDRGYGFSDGAYAAARLLELLSRHKGDGPSLLDELPASHATPELRVETGATDPAQLIAALTDIGRFIGSDDVITTDGLRIEYHDGFGTVRASPSGEDLVFRFEADSTRSLERIQTTFRQQLRRVAPRLQLPF